MKMKKILKLFILLLLPTITSCEINMNPNGADSSTQSSSSQNAFRVIWKNWDDSTLEIDNNVPRGTMPSFDGETPSRASTETIKYTFTGWTPEVKPITKNMTYKAILTPETRQYTIKWDLGNRIVEDLYEYGDIPSYIDKYGLPERPADSQYTYTFKQFTPSIEAVTENKTYTAIYDKSINNYTITWDLGYTTKVETYPYGATPNYISKYGIPNREPDNYYTYTFNRFTPAIESVTKNATYTAEYITEDRYFTIKWVVDGQETVEQYKYGQTPSYKNGTPTKPEATGTSYSFVRWEPAVGSVQGDQTYTAVFTSSTIIYTVKWIVNGVETTQTYTYGETPVFSGPTPTKASDNDYSYTWTGWDKSISPVTEDITYTATFEAHDIPYLYKNGSLVYSIKYVEETPGAKDGANKLASYIQQGLGKTVTKGSISNTQSINDTNKYIVFGAVNDASDNDISIGNDDGPATLMIKQKNNLFYVLANQADSYSLAARKIAEAVMGYDYFGTNTYVYEKVQPNTNLLMTNIEMKFTPSFALRRCDWSDPTYTGNDFEYNIGDGNHMTYMSIKCPHKDTNGSIILRDESFHTAFGILNPTTYATNHPKWYAEYKTLHKIINGQYVASANVDPSLGQLCFNARGDKNEYNEMVATAATNILNIASTTQNGRDTLSFSILDNTAYCQCNKCVDDETYYGSKTGAYIHFLNDVCAAVQAGASSIGKTKIPMAFLAYNAFTNAPNPSLIQTHENLSVLLAPIRADYCSPLDTTDNIGLVNQFQSWGKVCGNIHSWLYETNFTNYLYPMGTWKYMPEWMKMMKENNVALAYAQGQHNVAAQRTGFHDLKLYIDAKFMADVNSDYDALVDKYFTYNFGSNGGPYMRSFFNELVERSELINTTMRSDLYNDSSFHSKACNQAMCNTKFWPQSLIDKWVKYCEDAYASETNSQIKQNILAESIFPKFVQCTILADKYSNITAKRTSFKADCQALNITIWREGNGWSGQKDIGLPVNVSTNQISNSMNSYYDYWGIN